MLDYYHESQPGNDAPKGALGAEWLSLNLESLLAEREALLAHSAAAEDLSGADKARLALIEQHLKKLKPVIAKSSALELFAINLELPLKSKIRHDLLKESTIVSLEKWHHRLPGDDLDASSRTEAINALSSEITEDDFVLNFPAYLQQALIRSQKSVDTLSWLPTIDKKAQNSDELLAKKLLAFCSQTLIATRHIPLEKQESNIPMLCTILYRVLSNPSYSLFYNHKFKDFVSGVAVLPAPPLKVYQAKDIYKDILVSPEALIAQQELRPKPKPITLSKQSQTSLIKQTGIEAHLKGEKGSLNELLSHYQKAQEESEAQLKLLEPYLDKGIQHTLAAEEEAGTILFNLAQEKKLLATSLQRVACF